MKKIKKNRMYRPSYTLQNDTEVTLVLVDWSNLMYRAWFVSKEQPWVAYCKFFDMLRLCIRKSRQPGVPIKVIFAGESLQKLKRSEIFEEYKANRKPSDDPEFRLFRKEIVNLMKVLGWELVSHPGAEADDVIASIVAKACHRCFCKKKCSNCNCADAYKTDIIIFSGDRDLEQLLAWDRVLIWRAPGLFVDRATFEKEKRFPVVKYEMYKALTGDKSDNIPGVRGFGPVKAKIAIKADSVLEDVWESGGDEALAQLDISLALVKLDTSLSINHNDIWAGPPLLSNLPEDTHPQIVLELKRLREEFMPEQFSDGLEHALTHSHLET